MRFSIFKYFVKNEHELGIPPSIGICALESKNWALKLLISDLVPILFKATTLNSANLYLVLCNSFGASQAENCEAFESLCQTKSWNILKLRKLNTNNTNNKGFVLECYFPEMNFRLELYFTRIECN